MVRVWFGYLTEEVRNFLNILQSGCSSLYQQNFSLDHIREQLNKVNFFPMSLQPKSALPLLRVLDHTQTVGLLCVSDQLVAEAASYTTQNKRKRRISMPSARFEPAIPAIKRLQTFALDDTDTGTGWIQCMSDPICRGWVGPKRMCTSQFIAFITDVAVTRWQKTKRTYFTQLTIFINKTKPLCMFRLPIETIIKPFYLLII